jgi:hypothetical protein
MGLLMTLDTTPKAQLTKEMTDKLGFAKINNFPCERQ